MDNKLKVSIIMATYNRAQFIVETLHAIQKQTHSLWECFIIDDGGTDNTLEVIQPILNEDSRFSFLKRPNNYGKGLPGCRNYGIDIASGDYIIFFDDDDIPHPRNLELCLKELASEKYMFCRYLRAVFHNDFDYHFDLQENYDSFEISISDIAKMIDHTLPFNSCAVMWSKDCFNGIRFNENLMYAEEWECYTRILSENIVGISINKTLFYGRKHPNSNTGEYYRNDPVRQNSKKEAIILVMKHLNFKKLLTPYLFTYLSGLAIVFRDKKMVSNIIKSTALTFRQKLTLRLKYYAYPMWLVYKQTIASSINRSGKN